jgi:hypothetical protein
LQEPYQCGARSGKSTSQPSFRGDAQHRARNPSGRITRGDMDSGFAPSSRPGMTREELPDLALPVGQNTQAIGQDVSPKIFRFTEIRKRRMCRRNPAHRRGAYRDRHERGPGSGGRRWRWREQTCRAGNREQGRRAYDRCHQRTAKSCGPGARGLCAKSCGDVAARPGSHRQSSARRRGQ